VNNASSIPPSTFEKRYRQSNNMVVYLKAMKPDRKHSAAAISKLPDAVAAEMATSARDYRCTAAKISRNPRLAASFRRKAARLEEGYARWCQFHGRQPVASEPEPAAKPHRGRGGYRPGAGRKRTGNVAMLLRLTPGTAATLRRLANAAGVTVGAWLDTELHGR